MSTVSTLADIIGRMADEMADNTPPRVSLFETDPEVLAARKAAQQRFRGAYETGCRTVDAAVGSLSIVQVAKLDEILRRLSYHTGERDGRAHAICVIVRGETSPTHLRRLADQIRQEISAMAADA